MPNSFYKFFGASNLHELIFAKTKNGRVQFFRYLFVGGFSAVVNLAIFYICYSRLNIHYLYAELIAFTVATVVNYVLSVWWIFERSKRFGLEFALFTLVGVGGLGINELVLWVCVSKLGIAKLFGEAVAIAVVTVWSFALRRLMFNKL